MFQKAFLSGADSLLKYGSFRCAFLNGGLRITIRNKVVAAENRSAFIGSYSFLELDAKLL
jgi:hypothetical protein